MPGTESATGETRPDGTVIRRGRPEDAAAVEAVHRAAFFGAMPWMPDLHTREEGVRYFGRVLTKAEVWIAERSGEIVGFAALDGDMLAHLYVAPEAQRTGVGSTLFQRVTEARPSRFFLWAFQKNQRARDFYEQRGCRAIKYTDGRDNQERQPDVLYEWLPAQAGARST